ncbi:50S ribosomal protein L25/general stress protein Ctc [Paraperlucidibaca wandonensis]|jgi:large subunit ribosomal protein L25|uniref:Large ribosomal subunit protein bL25 n=1 Tax=Paraperlucidibaca wandonensis TaxID=1268273 RepID=A0ABW3HJT6_9GAMM|nr:50S ribosomal protein L25/general stress protein Ctc [Paraperlucidibaca sp.]MBQ0722051.1 50S ribosomal protein L25/general stress protein Ctc [Paraperlucidibaca sp.]MBQ0841500.1 50S ribosomal protein L25/general stress protein Ctc [Paraperlucidibaca sp.]|tara:strand:- start:145 stop:786 length:642 start_codon:yes stop_codon:yes gene_type:complete
MSAATFTLDAQNRTLEGKGASRRLRRLEARVPAVIYGGEAAAQSISIELRQLVKALENEAFYSHVLTITVDGKAEKVVIKALQRHPVKSTPMHADFLRVDAKQKLTMRVPLHFTNQDTCVGVKQDGGEITHYINDVEVSCLPGSLPEFIEVDMAAVALGTTLHLSNLVLPKGVEILALALGHDHDQPVANVHAPKVAAASEDDAAPEAAPEAE